MMADEQETSSSEASETRVLDAFSPRHRERIVKAAADEAVTVKVWVERAIDQSSDRSKANSEHAESSSEQIAEDEIDTRSELEAGRGPRRTHGHGEGAAKDAVTRERIEPRKVSAPASHKQSAKSGAAHRPEQIGVETVAEEVEVKQVGPARAETTRRHETRRVEHRADGEMSEYHSRIAARAAAAEGLPLTVWLEQAILDRARPARDATERVESVQTATRSASGSAAPPVAVIESGPRGFGVGALGALLLGAVLTALLFLILPWLIFGRPLFPGAASSSSATTTRSSTEQLPTPLPIPAPSPAVAPAASPTPNVVVTTVVDNLARAPGSDGSIGIGRGGRHDEVGWRHRSRWSNSGYSEPGQSGPIIVDAPDKALTLDRDCNCYLSTQ